MLIQRKALLLVGSPKLKNSNSEALGSYLLERLQDKGYSTNRLTVNLLLNGGFEEFIHELDNADIVILAFPLYIDGLPAPLVRVMELITENRKAKQPSKVQNLMAIVNGGYPEAFQNDTALKICRNFAERNAFKWLGGMAMGQGGLLHGRIISKKGMTGRIAKALDLTADAIAAKENVPLRAMALMAKPILPIFAYIAYCHKGWSILAKPYNTQKLLYERPLKKE